MDSLSLLHYILYAHTHTQSFLLLYNIIHTDIYYLYVLIYRLFIPAIKIPGIILDFFLDDLTQIVSVMLCGDGNFINKVYPVVNPDCVQLAQLFLMIRKQRFLRIQSRTI